MNPEYLGTLMVAMDRLNAYARSMPPVVVK